MQAGGVLNALGSGLVLPFVLVYLHDTQGLSLGLAGLAVGGFGLASLVVTPLAGTLVDRLGARSVLRASLAVLALGYALLPLVHGAAGAFVALAVAGCGNGGFWPSQSAVVMGLCSPEQRHQASAVARATFNVGLGAGGALGGLALAGASSGEFRLLFELDALSFVLFALATCAVPAVRAGRAAGSEQRAGYGVIARDRILLALVALNVVYVACAFAPFEAALPVYAHDRLGLSTRAIGLVCLANMLAVGVLQLPAARLIEGRRRMRMLAGMTGLFALAFVLICGAGSLPQGLALAAVLVAAVVFAAGECILGPTHGPAVVALAPPALRGRYLALLTASYAVGFTLGPPVAALGLSISPGAVWIGAASVCALAAAAGLALERRLPETLRVTPVSP